MNEHTNPIKQLGNTNCFFKGIENLRTTWPLLAVLRLQRGSIYPPTCFLLPPAVGVTEIVKNNRLVQGVAHTGARVICDGYLQLILFKHFQTMLIKILTFSKKDEHFLPLLRRRQEGNFVAKSWAEVFCLNLSDLYKNTRLLHNVSASWLKI